MKDGKWVVSKYHGRCKACGSYVHPGERIFLQWSKPKYILTCQGCQASESERNQRQPLT